MTRLAKPFAFALALTLAGATGAIADDDMIIKPSAHDVETTIDRLQSIVEERGVTVMARVDHAKNAAGVGMELRPTQLLIFGNPKLGSVLMEADQRIGLDLPMKVLAWQDANGATWVGYWDPEDLADRYEMARDHEVVQRLHKALAAFTTAATAAE